MDPVDGLKFRGEVPLVPLEALAGGGRGTRDEGEKAADLSREPFAVDEVLWGIVDSIQITASADGAGYGPKW